MSGPEEPRKRPRQSRSRVTVDAIVEAAARIFDAEGFEATTTNRVAEVAGVSVGTLYQYFPNKDALLTALHERHAAEVACELRATLARPCAPLREELADLSTRLVRLHARSPRLQRLLHVERPWLERGADDPAAAATLALARDFLARHEERITVGDPHAAALTLVRMVESMVHATVLEPDPLIDADACARAIAEAVEGYLVLPRDR